MLGCQDFCGYYDWTFHFVRCRFGDAAVEALWAQAIGGESQAHYADAAAQDGLRGLLKTWNATGEDEQCDWTFTLNEAKNVLRWDMRACPSKGHLMQHDQAQDTDYCDHCMGWIAPLLAAHGIEIAAHEHNHAGQCWTEMCVKSRRMQSPEAPDIRQDPRWRHGYVDRWEHSVKLPVLPAVSTSTQPQNVLRQWFGRYERLLVLGRGPSATDGWARAAPTDGVLITDPTYATRDVFAGEPAAVLIGDRPREDLLQLTSRRWAAAPVDRRPLLLHTYLPRGDWPAWSDYGLPRPLPILPLLIDANLYRHEPEQPYPSSGTFLVLLAAALDTPAAVTGIDLYDHPKGQRYAHQPSEVDIDEIASTPHTPACELAHLRGAAARLGDRLTLHPLLRQRVDG